MTHERKYKTKEELIAAAREKGLYPPEDATAEQLAEFRKAKAEHYRKGRAKYAHLDSKLSQEPSEEPHDQ